MFQDGGGGRICFTRDATNIGVIQKVRSLKREEVLSLKANKNEQGEGGGLACVYVRFFSKKMLRSKSSFLIILQFFLLIIMAVWNIKLNIMKDYIIQSCQWMACNRFRQPTQDHYCGLYLFTLYMINLVRCISQFKCFKFPRYIFYFRPALFFKKQVICWDEQLTSNF